MTTQEFKDFLNEWYPPKPRDNKNVEANAQLSQQDIDTLKKFVEDFEKDDENYDWEGNLDPVIKVARKFNVETTVKKDNINSISKNNSSYPFMIKQVLFYLGVACTLYKKDGKPLASQADIIAVLNKKDKKSKSKSSASQAEILTEQSKKDDKGLNLSHNFFSRLGVTEFVAMIEYKQPPMLFNYAGQKHDELGVAIKHLVHQAGTYDVFVDIFGGSGAASVAFPRKSNPVYIYNDLDENLANLFDIIADDKDHLTLIEYLRELQIDLCNDFQWVQFDFDLKQEALDYFNRRVATGRSRETDAELSIIYDAKVTDVELQVIKDINNTNDTNDTKYAKYEKYIEYITSIMLKLDSITTKNSFLYSKEDNAFLDKLFEKYKETNNVFELVVNFWSNYNDIHNFITRNHIPINLYDVTYKHKDGDLDLNTDMHKFHAAALRFYEWYALFDNILEDKTHKGRDDKFLCGIATIFRYYFTTKGKIGNSPILRINVEVGDERTDDLQWKDFLEEDFEKLINDLYSLIKKNDEVLSKRAEKRKNQTKNDDNDRSIPAHTIIEQMDCVDLIKKYQSSGVASFKHNKPLFYSDSPYSATSDYKVGKFSDVDMKNLIEALKVSGDRFIFSCRACKGSVQGSKTTDELKKGNQIIIKEVFDVFQSTFNTKKIYVLTIETGVDFWQAVRDNKITEIMITNYKIEPFKDGQYPNAKYKVYLFDDFMKKLNQNINK